MAAAKPSSEVKEAELLRLSAAVEEGWLYARIVRTTVWGRVTYRAQFVCDGVPPQRHERGTEKVSLDLGPSVVDVVHDTGSFTETLAAKVEDRGADLRRQQRRLDRQHRAGSPECFAEDGTHTKGRCLWEKRSKGAKRTQNRIAEIHRKTAEYRRCEHGRMWNRIMAIGTDVRLEKLDYTAWQKMFSRSVRNRAPGLFVEIGHRKAASADGSFYEFNTWATALSQTCVCGRRNKKHLSERVHRCQCGVVAPRDRFSAFLGLYVHRHVDQETGEVFDLLDVKEASIGFLSRHDIGGHPALSSIKPRGSRRGRGIHPRAVARRRARLSSGGDRGVRGKRAQPMPTAHVATTQAVAA